MRLLLIPLFLISLQGFAAQSTITEADGESCMGDDKTRRQTEQAALEIAKRMAVEYTSSHIGSTTVVENFELKSDIVEAFTQAEVKLLEVLNRDWRQNGPIDLCINLRIKAEVIPAAAQLQKVDSEQLKTDPRLPLNVDLWVNASDAQFTEGDKMKIYLRGNKPFYGRLVYVDSKGNNVQLLPTQHRRDNYFQGGTMFEIPTGNDKFELTVTGPFGEEQLILYASTEQLGNINTAPAGKDFYVVNDGIEQVAVKTRGIAIEAKDTNVGRPGVAEFAETAISIRTRPRP